MTTAELIQFLRISVNVQTSSESVTDPYLLKMTDEQMELFLKVVVTRDFPMYSLDTLPQSAIYPVILLSKKELYFALASVNAPLYDLNADTNNSLKRSQRFEHYMAMIKAVDDEYDQYNEDGGAGHNTLTSFDVLLPDRSTTKRNYEKGVIPAPFVVCDSVGVDFVEFHWMVSMSKFFQYKVYLSSEPILDEFTPDNPINSSARLMKTIRDVNQTSMRITGLLPDTTYYVVVSATEWSSLTGYYEIQFTTNKLLTEEEPNGD